MKKLSLLFLALASLLTLNAQWVDDPNSNTSIANCNKNAAEVYVSTDITTGDSYVQWHYQGENGWSPWSLIDNDDRGQELHADSAYIGKNVKSVMRKYQMKSRVIKRSVRGKKLSKKQETVNRKNSKTRVRVEHGLQRVPI